MDVPGAVVWAAPQSTRVWVTRVAPHHSTRALGADEEPGGSSTRELALWAGQWREGVSLRGLT